MAQYSPNTCPVLDLAIKRFVVLRFSHGSCPVLIPSRTDMLSHRGPQLYTQAHFKWMDCEHSIGFVLRCRLTELGCIGWCHILRQRIRVQRKSRPLFVSFPLTVTLLLRTLDISKYFWTFKHFEIFVNRPYLRLSYNHTLNFLFVLLTTMRA